VEAELLERLEAVDDAAPAAAAADLGPPSSMAKTPSRLKQTSPISDLLAGELLLRGGLDDGRAGLPPNSSEVVSLFGSQPMSSTFLPCCAIM
jgi:hypothetical protein